MDTNTKEQVVALARKLLGMVQKKQPLESVPIPAQNIRLMSEYILDHQEPEKPATQPLTVKQKDCLQAIIKLTGKLGQSPSVRQVADELGLPNHSAAAALIQHLVTKGYVERSPSDKMLKVLSTA